MTGRSDEDITKTQRHCIFFPTSQCAGLMSSCTTLTKTYCGSTKEQRRLQAQHEGLIALMHGKPFHNPVDVQKVKLALDIGCGTGDMTLLLAEHFPNATVYGMDLSPVPDSARHEASRFGGRIQFLQGNIFHVFDNHPSLRSGTFDFIFHRSLYAGIQSYMGYLREVVMPLLRPGGWVEMHDVPGLDFYQSDPNAPGSAICVSDDWLWRGLLRAAEQQRGRRDGFDTIFSSLQMLDFEDVGQRIIRLPWAPVEGQPEAERWAAYAPQASADAILTSILKASTNDDIKRVGAENVDRSIQDTIGKPVEHMWWPFGIAWGRKPA